MGRVRDRARGYGLVDRGEIEARLDDLGQDRIVLMDELIGSEQVFVLYLPSPLEGSACAGYHKRQGGRACRIFIEGLWTNAGHSSTKALSFDLVSGLGEEKLERCGDVD